MATKIRKVEDDVGGVNYVLDTEDTYWSIWADTHLVETGAWIWSQRTCLEKFHQVLRHAWRHSRPMSAGGDIRL